MNTLTISVTSIDGQPVADARVTYADAERNQRHATTDERGRATFDADPQAAATVTVLAGDLAPDSRAIGAPYPTRPDGVEQFILGPVGAAHYYRGRVKVPFVPVLDAVGMRVPPDRRQPTGAPDGPDGPDELVPGAAAERFSQNAIAVVRPVELSGAQPDHADISRSELRQVDDYIRELNGRDDAEAGQVGALVALTDTGASFLTDTVVVSLVDDSIDPVDVAARHGLEIVKRFGALKNTYVLRYPGDATYALLDVANALATDPSVRYAEPNLVTTVELDAVTPNDFLFPQQWDFAREGMPDAWQVLRGLNNANTFGSPDITVAVVDSGIDPAHPSFSGNLSDGTAKLRTAFDFVANVANNTATATSTTASDHGISCSSAAVGFADNGEGMAGVAGNCHLISVNQDWGAAETEYAELYLWLAGLDADNDAAWFPAQLADGADVISNSFGFSVNSPISALMSDTFDTVTDDGRDGRGVVLCFSAGNDNVDLDTTNRRPWSMYGRCYGVAAATFANDGTTEVKAGYSNFGSTVDFCALSNDNDGAHNPNQAFGAFTATLINAPGGDAIPGSAVNTTTLSAASAANASSVTVASLTGATVGGSVLIGNVANATARGRRITAIDTTTRVLSLDMALPAAFANGTAVAFAPRRYRSNFGGTSYATPVTAGVAALMLSANPQLQWNEVGDILRRTAVKIDTGNTNATGRWRDVNGLISTDPGYAGPAFSEFYGAGRINPPAAVRRAAWTIDLRTPRLQFIDIPEGETTYRAVRWDVRSLYASTFTVTANPGPRFSFPNGPSESLSGTVDYAVVQEGYLWVAFTGRAPGTTNNTSLTVRHDQTGEEWVIPISANSIAPKSSCVMLVLDRSGSMSAPSGVGSNDRMQVLHYSAGILAEAVHEGDGVGIVGFDHDSFDVLTPPVGPLPAPSLFDPVRDQVRQAISTYATNINGFTSIGDGLERGQGQLAGVTTYDNKATVVFTDGYETASKWISDVAGSITDRTYAVALGRAENIKPAALTAVTKGTGGYCVLTDDLNNDSRYKLAKYFLQVLAGVRNDQIVLDPPVAVRPGQVVEVPFLLSEADFSADVVFMTRFPWLVDMTLVTPDGDEIDPAFMAGLSGRNVLQVGNDVVYYRLTLPAPIGAGAHAGTWLARFYLDERKVKEATEANPEKGPVLTKADVHTLYDEGLAGTLVVNCSSNLRLAADAFQDSYEPGAKAVLTASLMEYDVPVIGRAEVIVEITEPGGGSYLLPLNEGAGGVFEEAFVTNKQGVYTCLYRAKGKTWHGAEFTREAVRTISVWEGGDRYEPEEGPEPFVEGEARPPHKPPRIPPHRLPHAWEVVLADPRLVSMLQETLAREGFSLNDLEPAGK
ncbi:MAG: S8 family serine peptidase [Nocardioides sp.]